MGKEIYITIEQTTIPNMKILKNRKKSHQRPHSREQAKPCSKLGDDKQENFRFLSFIYFF